MTDLSEPQSGRATVAPRRRRLRRLPLILVPVALALAAIVLAVIFLMKLSHGQSVPVVIPQHASPQAAFPGAPRAQAGLFGRHGYACALAAPNRYLPRRSGCVQGLYADVEGTGHQDLVLLYARLGTQQSGRDDYAPIGYSLEVVPPHGPAMTTSLGPAAEAPSILRAGRLNAEPGAELILQPTIGGAGGSLDQIYADTGHRLHAIAIRLLAGSDSADDEGFSCRTGIAPTLVTRTATLLGPTINGRWRWTVTTYRWDGSRPDRVDVRRFVRRGRPGRASATAGAGCGQVVPGA